MFLEIRQVGNDALGYAAVVGTRNEPANFLPLRACGTHSTMARAILDVDAELASRNLLVTSRTTETEDGEIPTRVILTIEDLGL